MQKVLLALSFSLLVTACAMPDRQAEHSGAEITRIAFGSCADQNKPQPVWAGVRATKPDLFLFLGDNVYGDVSGPEMTELKDAYAVFGRNGDVAALRAETRVLATWDDHDYGRNDAGADFPFRSSAEALFLDFWDVPAGDPRRARDGIYFAETHGPPGRRVQVIMLDTRSFRSTLSRTGEREPKYRPDPNPAKTMLGPAQWAWLESELRKPAELRLIVSSIQVAATAHGWERWGNLPRERARLYDLIARTRANAVVILSGDRHIGAIYVEREDVPYPIYEVTGSSFNLPWRGREEQDPNQIGAVVSDENFGTVDIDWQSRTVTLALRGLSGQVVRKQTIDLASLAP